MRERVAQPPIQPALRDPERHDFWPGFVGALMGVIVLLCGAFHLTGLETTDGGTAREAQLVTAFAMGGVQWKDLSAPTAPAKDEDPAATARALEELEKRVNEGGPRWVIRVDTGAKTPCPT
ncbi:MAG: hypothetical protein HZA90_04190 [Verrucomicrobia bacterium]|nr:hypothetical protein [Verrucomicrobiota bacterium]